jgi:hypothetical protein
VDIS